MILVKVISDAALFYERGGAPQYAPTVVSFLICLPVRR